MEQVHAAATSRPCQLEHPPSDVDAETCAASLTQHARAEAAARPEVEYVPLPQRHAEEIEASHCQLALHCCIHGRVALSLTHVVVLTSMSGAHGGHTPFEVLRKRYQTHTRTDVSLLRFCVLSRDPCNHPRG